MRTSRRVAVAAACFTLGAASVVSPVQAAPSNGARPDTVNSAKHAAPGQQVAKDGDGRTIVYVDGAQVSSLRAAVAKAGGVVADTDVGRVKAAVPQEKLDLVASQPGVTEVRLPDRAVPMAVTSEGVRPSRADEWVAAGKTGAGVKIGIIDVGFGGLAAAQAAGELPPTGPRLAYNSAGCLDATVKTEHGTNVAEIVHDMAPGADLYLACVEDSVSFSAAADWLDQQGVKIITSAVGFLSPAGGRGDGTGATPDSPAEVVKRSRAKGILWSVAAGNLARTHFGGTPVDANGNKWVEFRDGVEFNSVTLAANQKTTFSIRWDAWPKTNQDLDLYVMDQQIHPDAPNAPAPKAVSRRAQQEADGGLDPTEEVTLTNTAASSRTFYVYVKNNNARFTTPFELFVAGPQQIQYWTERGSVVEPATSPHVIAVGATEPGSGQVEEFSGRGPTVDGRTKPDITGFDNVSTSLWGERGFRGTSAAAAHVAGAAAVFKSANPALDATQLQSALQSRATLPPGGDRNAWGSGALNLGPPTSLPEPAAGAGFTVDQVPTRVLSEPFAAGQTKTLAFPGLPGGTTAVAITVSARADQNDVGDFAIEVAPGDPAALAGKVPALHARGDNGWSWQSLTLFAPLDSARSLKLRNRGNGAAYVVVERLGYFHPSQSTDSYFTKPAPARVLDTRGFGVAAGGSDRKVPLNGGNRDTAELQIRGVAGVPQNATAVVANLTAFEATAQSFLVAHGGATVPGTTSVVVSPGDRRTNLVVVPIGSDGKIRLTNTTGTHVVNAALDVVGWFGPDSGGAKYVTMADVGRVADTATGNGVAKAPIGHGQTASFQVGGVAGVPVAATTAAVVLTGRDDNLGTELSVVASEVGWTAGSQVATRKLETASGLALVPMGESGKVDVRNERGQARLTADVTGYFVGGVKVATPAVAGNCVTAKDEPGFNSVFDGRYESDLAGWQSTGAKMTAEGCELLTANTTDVNWYAAHTYGNDYTLKLDWKATSAASDSGVFVGITNPGTDAGHPHQSGYEVQISPTNAPPEWQTGAIVGARSPHTTQAVKPVGEWNTFEFRYRWNTVTVYLNGQLVNEYAYWDATAAGRNTFIGIQNDNNGEPVRFRNVRIKRDTPVRSGALQNASGKCLDVYGANPKQQVVQLWPCHNGFAQVWTMNDGLVQAGSRCLRAVGNGEGTLAILDGCAGDDYQQWVLRGDNRLVHRSSGRCLTPQGTADGARLELRGCDTSNASQTWAPPSAAGVGRSGQIVGPLGKCLDVFDNDPTLNKAGIFPCHGGMAQAWVAPGDGTVRGGGKCLDVASLTPGEGSSVNIADCNGAQHQQWVAQPDGTLVNPLSGRCLTSANADHSQMTITTCSGAPSQSFRLSSQRTWVGSVVGLATKCLDVFGGNPAGKINLHDCNGSPAQNWWATGDGALRAYSHCLDIQSPANGAIVSLAGPCRGDGGQVWSGRHNATIVNPISNRCLDDYGAFPDNGTQIIISDCHAGLNQRWATPVSPS